MMAAFVDKEYLRDADSIRRSMRARVRRPLRDRLPPCPLPTKRRPPGMRPAPQPSEFLDLGATFNAPRGRRWRLAERLRGGGKVLRKTRLRTRTISRRHRAECWPRSVRGSFPAPRSAMFRRSCPTSPPPSRQPTPRWVVQACPAQNKRSAPAISDPQHRQYRSRAGESGGAESANRTSPGARGCPAEKTADTAPDANPAETTDLAEAGDAENTAQIDENRDAAVAEMEAMIAENPDLFVGLTVEEAEEIVQQIQIELSHINKGTPLPVRHRTAAAISPISLRAISIWQA